MKKHFLYAALALTSISPALAEDQYEMCGCPFKKLKAPDFIIEAEVKGGPELYRGWAYPGYHFSTRRLWKVPPAMPQEVVIDGQMKDNKCSVKFEVGKSYLIKGIILKLAPEQIASKEQAIIKERWLTTPCYRPKPIEDAAEEIKSLGEPVKVFTQE